MAGGSRSRCPSWQPRQGTAEGTRLATKNVSSVFLLWSEAFHLPYRDGQRAHGSDAATRPYRMLEPGCGQELRPQELGFPPPRKPRSARCVSDFQSTSCFEGHVHKVRSPGCFPGSNPAGLALTPAPRDSLRRDPASFGAAPEAPLNTRMGTQRKQGTNGLPSPGDRVGSKGRRRQGKQPGLGPHASGTAKTALLLSLPCASAYPAAR